MSHSCDACGAEVYEGSGGKTSGRKCPSCNCWLHSACTEWWGCDACGQEVCEECISNNVNARGICFDASICLSCREA